MSILTSPKAQGALPKLFMIGLALTPFIAILSPRFMAFWPGILGVIGLCYYSISYKLKPVIPLKFLMWAGSLLLLAGLSYFWALDPDFVIERTIKIALILLPSAALISFVMSVDVNVIKPYGRYLLISVFVAALICALEIFACLARSDRLSSGFR